MLRRDCLQGSVFMSISRGLKKHYFIWTDKYYDDLLCDLILKSVSLFSTLVQYQDNQSDFPKNNIEEVLILK